MRNVEAFVEEALASILCERTVPLEVVVVDDGSTDASRARVAAVSDPRVRLVDGPRRGIAACLNAGIAAARGDILMRCDADDLFSPGRIARQTAWLAQHPTHAAVCGAYTSIDRRGRFVAQLCLHANAADVDVSEELCRGVTRTSLCTFAMHRAVVEKIGGFREYFVTCEDVDFMLRLGEAAKVHYLPENTYVYRLHEASITHTQATVQRQFYEEMAHDFQAQRLGQGSDALQRNEAPSPPAGAHTRASTAASQIQGMLVGRAWRLFEQGERREALVVAVRAVRHGPRQAVAWRTLVLVAWRSLTRARVKPAGTVNR
jgi:glycosyltransferase involved in cell wall biosynthesis